MKQIFNIKTKKVFVVSNRKAEKKVNQKQSKWLVLEGGKKNA